MPSSIIPQGLLQGKIFVQRNEISHSQDFFVNDEDVAKNVYAKEPMMTHNVYVTLHLKIQVTFLDLDSLYMYPIFNGIAFHLFSLSYEYERQEPAPRRGLAPPVPIFLAKKSFRFENNLEQAEAEVVPSSSLVKLQLTLNEKFS